MKKILFYVLCVLTAISAVCASYVIIDYMKYNSSIQEEKIEKIETEIDDVDKQIEEENKKVDDFKKENSEKVGKLELWEKEIEKVE